MINCIYNFFNNATVGALVAVVVAGAVGSWQYRKQKDIDRAQETKKDIIGDLILLNEKASYVLLIIDRIANSYSRTDKSGSGFLQSILEHEIPRLSDAINEDIPYVDKKIEAKLRIYFKGNSKIDSAYESLKKELKNWHSPLTTQDLSLVNRVDKQPKLSIERLNNEIKTMIDLVWQTDKG